jgi:RNA polymerase sigma-70 factor, ECF subfamily
MRLAVDFTGGPRETAQGGETAAVRDGAAEHELVALLRLGDVGAFEKLYRQHSAELYRFAFGYVRRSEVAEEIVQDVFFHLWQHRARWDATRPITAHLFVATRNRALDHLRRERVAERTRADVGSHEGPVPGMGAPGPRADEALDEARRRRILDEAILRLPERARLAFVLYWQHGLRYAEVAAVMNVSIKTVEKQLAAALRALRAQLGRAGRDLDA